VELSVFIVLGGKNRNKYEKSEVRKNSHKLALLRIGLNIYDFGILVVNRFTHIVHLIKKIYRWCGLLVL
jgi:hypothetical protein